MNRRVGLLVIPWVLIASVSPGAGGPQSAPSPSPPSHQALLNRYCISCHNERTKTAGLMLDKLDLSNIGAGAEVWEKVVRKLNAGVMPPLGMPRPDKSAADSFRSWLETQLDRAAAAQPDPGRTQTFHRLNRAEYHNAIRDLLDIELDVAGLLPGDDASYGFDNIAGVLRFSPALMERYLVAAKRISRVAIGTPPPFPNFDVFRVADDLPQEDKLEGLPFGTRGGTLIRYNFPVDGEYTIRVRLARQLNSQDLDVPRFDEPQELEISLDGERLRVFTLDAFDTISSGPEPGLSGGPQTTTNSKPPIGSGSAALPSRARERGNQTTRTTLDTDWEVRFSTKAGPQEIAVTFLNSTRALRGTLVRPYVRPYPPGTNQWGSRKGAYLGKVEISGPFRQIERQEQAPSRRRIFVCHPNNPTDEPACAKSILATLARRAYRRPIIETDMQELVGSYNEGRADGGFEAGIEFALRRLLVSPEFLFRTEADPAGVAPNTAYRIADMELASRLSFFLWSSVPDDELLNLAHQGKLKDPAVLEGQVHRMLADVRSKAIVANFAGQWLYLRNVPSLGSEPYKDPDFDESLRQALRRETELFVESIISEDRSVLDLLTADYTFLNERLAKHYGIPNLSGSHFRRVVLPEGSVRRGLLGKGSILAVTSYANRTSPVNRGKWILENILGTPPPAPPPNVPALDEKQKGPAALTMRDRMVQHRANPVCASCHSMMDPLGFALENFDQTGRWREMDRGFDSRRADFSQIDVSGVLPDGTKFNGPIGLREALLSRPEQFVTTMTEKLLTYALGRGLEYYDAPTVRSIVREARRKNYRFSSLVVGIVNSAPFRMRRSES